MKYREYIKVFDLNSGVTKSKHLRPSAVLVYGYIHGWWENHQTGCETTYEKVAGTVKIARSTFAEAIVRLEELGWISVKHGARVSKTKNKCNVYCVKRMPDPTVKHTKKVVVRNNDITEKPEKSEWQKQRDKKFAALNILKGTISDQEYDSLRKVLKV